MGWDVARRPRPRADFDRQYEAEPPPPLPLSACCAAPMVLAGEGRVKHYRCSACRCAARRPGSR